LEAVLEVMLLLSRLLKKDLKQSALKKEELSVEPALMLAAFPRRLF